MRNAVTLMGAILLLAAAFYAGTWFPHNAPAPSVKPRPILPNDEVSLDPAKQLELNTLCAQSADTIAKEKSLAALGAVEEHQHAYNPKLAKCFVLVSSFISAGPSADSYAYTFISLYDALTGTSFGDFQSRFGPRGGAPQKIISLCSKLPDGKTVHECVTEDQWRAYVEQMMHG